MSTAETKVLGHVFADFLRSSEGQRVTEFLGKAKQRIRLGRVPCDSGNKAWFFGLGKFGFEKWEDLGPLIEERRAKDSNSKPMVVQLFADQFAELWLELHPNNSYQGAIDQIRYQFVELEGEYRRNVASKKIMNPFWIIGALLVTLLAARG